MSDLVVIRPAETADLESVVEIERASFSDPWTLGAFRSALQEARLNFHVAVHEAAVASRLLARVDEVSVKAGQAVKQDDVLVRLDDKDLQARHKQAILPRDLC